MLKLKILSLLMSLCLCLPLGAQTLPVEVSFADTALYKNNWYISSINAEGNRVPQKLELKGQCLQAEVPVDANGFYQLSGVRNGAQVFLPLYLSKTSKPASIAVTFNEGCPQANIDNDNRALSAYNAEYFRLSREMWMKGREMSAEQLFANFKAYLTAADSIATHYKCSAPVKHYLSLWAYTLVSDAFYGIPNITGKKHDAFPFQEADLLAAPHEVLDTPLALNFGSVTLIVERALPRKGLKGDLDYLDKHYSCALLKKRVAERLVSEFIRKFVYSNNYEQGLADLTAAVEQFGLSDKSVKDFKSRRASVVGAPFPVEVLLEDADGNRVDFSTFKGYYVYIDLWASWCVPCIREVPHLQKLEKELQNDKVKFVSISIDRGTKEWTARMKALNLHGIQLINRDNKLGEVLNISGIPRFLIYDKEGKLYNHNAPRPSSGEQLKQLLENLK